MDSIRLKAKRAIRKHCRLVNLVFYKGMEFNNSKTTNTCTKTEEVNKWITDDGS